MASHTIAIMQPYLFPYVGYFQLICAVDEFVIFDDVQYIKRGFVNRNFVLRGEAPVRFTAPVIGASQSKNFNEVMFAPQEDLLAMLDTIYRHAPQYRAVSSMLRSILEYPDRRVAHLIAFSLTRILEFLGIQRKITFASSAAIANDIRGEDRVLAICRTKGADRYINAPGGRGMYNSDKFAAMGIDLRFLEPGAVTYPQFGAAFVPNLSIVDVLMFNPVPDVADFTSRFAVCVS